MLIQGRLLKPMGLILAACLLGGAAYAKPPAVPGEYVVKLKNSAKDLPSHQIAAALGASKVKKLSPQSNAVLLERKSGESRQLVINNLTHNPRVEYAEPNYIYEANVKPNDPKLDQLWGLINQGQEINSVGSLGTKGLDVDAKRAWDIHRGDDNVVVAVIDTGVDYTIPDLGPNMWKNSAEANGEPGVDDDSNGYVDDIYGYDFANDDADPKDDHGHGSHCSGTIGARGNNNTGVVGVNWKTQIMALKFLSENGGGTLADAVSAIDYATEQGADIMSNSWGGGGFSKTLKEAIQRARDKGVLFIAAAGNSGTDNDKKPTYPANYEMENIISVAAINNKGQLASFSSYGKTTVDLAAPGVDILSTVPGGFEYYSGTSMAAPHVSGVAALVLSDESQLSTSALKERLLSTAQPLAELRNKVATNGMVNAYHALNNSQPPPDPDDPANWNQKSHEISTPHPYKEQMKKSWTVSVDGAERVAVYFSKFNTERGYDRVIFKNASGDVVDVWSGDKGSGYSPSVRGESMTITLETDKSRNQYGFDLTGIAFE